MADPPKPDELVLVGAVMGAFGVKGEVRVRPFTATPEGLCAYGPLLRDTGAIALTPKRWRPIKDGLALIAPEVPTREAAEALRNTRLYIPRSRLAPVEEDEFYHVDLIGCRVEGLTGEALGMVLAVQNYGAGELLEIKAPSGKTWFLPFTKAAAPVVDLQGRRIVADPPQADDPPPDDVGDGP